MGRSMEGTPGAMIRIILQQWGGWQGREKDMRDIGRRWHPGVGEGDVRDNSQDLTCISDATS